MISMYEQIFGNYPKIKVINYILINPEREYTKKEIAVGANISRVTLDSFVNDLEELNILIKNKSKYKLNLKSKVVKTLIDTQVKIAELVMLENLEQSDIIMAKEVSDDEFEEFMDALDYEVDLDEELEKIEHNEHITITKKEYELLKSQQDLINASQNTGTNFIINAYYPEKQNKRMINYG